MRFSKFEYAKFIFYNINGNVKKIMIIKIFDIFEPWVLLFAIETIFMYKN